MLPAMLIIALMALLVAIDATLTGDLTRSFTSEKNRAELMIPPCFL